MALKSEPEIIAFIAACERQIDAAFDQFKTLRARTTLPEEIERDAFAQAVRPLINGELPSC